MKHLLTLMDMEKKEIESLLTLAKAIKKNPKKYSQTLSGKTLLMIFEKPSLRTRLSFDVGMHQLGGHAIVMDTGSAPLGEKESIEDTAKVCSRYVQGIMARLFLHSDLEKLATSGSVPVINGHTNDFHPVQILSDLLTISEKKGKLSGLKVCFLGDGNNNVTHSLLIGCALLGIDISIGCPTSAMPSKKIVDFAKNKHKGVVVTTDASVAISGADVVYADSWMSYHIPSSEKKKRVKLFTPYQVNDTIVKKAKKDFIFMNCLPAMRGYEQTASIIDGKHSVVFDQAENRLHMQKAILVSLLK